jgi:hypothetical protein
MPEDIEHLPGEGAAETGHYEELNVFGTPTGDKTHAQQGERLPVSPRGFTWRKTEHPSC